MRTLFAPVLLFSSLILGSTLLSAGMMPHPDESRRERHYQRSVAVVWALDSIKDDVSCHDALQKFGNDFNSLPSEARAGIIETYEDLMGVCNDNDPPRSAREQASQYIRGFRVKR